MPEDKAMPAPPNDSGEAGKARRIAILAADAQAGDALWGAIEARVRNKDRIALFRAPREQADIVVYMPRAGDLAGVGEDAAPLKFLILPEGAPVAPPQGVTLLRGTREEQAKEILRAPAKAEHAAKKEQRTEGRKRPSEEIEAAKAARKAAKLAAKAPVEASKPALSPEDAEAAKVARKVAKHAAKEQAKAERAAKNESKPGKPKPSPEESEAAKAARKAAKTAAKEQADTERAAKREQQAGKPKLSPEEIEVAKAARKAAKHAAKEQAAGERAAKKEKKAGTPKLSPEDAEAAKAARKAAKLAAKEAAEAGTPALSPEEAEAAKVARKAAKHAAKEQAAGERAAKKEKKAETPELSPEEAEAAKAARKAAKLAAKAQSGNKSAKTSEKPELSPEEAEAAKAARKAAKAAEKAAGKAAAKAGRVSGAQEQASPDDLAAKAERKSAKQAAKGEKKAERRTAKDARGGEDDDEDGEAGAHVAPLKFRIAGLGPERGAALAQAVVAAFREASAEIHVVEDHGDVVIRAFDDPPLGPSEIAAQAGAIGAEDIRCQIFLERTAPGDDLDAANHAIARLAAESGSVFLSQAAKFRRFGREGLDLVAEAIRGVIAAQYPRRPLALPPRLAPPDLVEARALTVDALLAELRWSENALPKSVWFPISQEMTEGFADSKIVNPFAEPIPFTLPLDWSMEMPDRRQAQLFKGLEFLSGPIAYWYGKANGKNAESIGLIDAALKQRGTTPNALFARATQLILDFIAKHPPAAAPDAWIQNAIERRARLMMAWLLCAKTARKRKLAVNEAAARTIYAHLLDLLEYLRADDFYVPGSSDGVQQDCTLIGLALCLRGTAYGNWLIAEGLERLKTMQLAIGLTADGVWRDETYAIHCLVLGVITVLIGDFPSADAAQIEPLAAITKKMTLFSEAVLKSDGAPPAFDGSKQKSYSSRIAMQRRLIAKAGGRQAAGPKALQSRITDTYVFREAQYFISHSSQKMEGGSSLVILHAEPASAMHGDPGGLVLAFACGDKDLIVRAAPPDKQADAQDPRLRNFYRIGDGGKPQAGSGARIVKSWRGPGWVAARALEDGHAQGAVERIVVHLKAAHALVVVDALASAAGAGFEQFWNVAPGFVPGEDLRFSDAADSHLALAFCDGAAAGAETGEGGTRLSRSLAPGLTASVLQWADGPAPLSIALKQTQDGWTARVEGKEIRCGLRLAGGELTCQLG
jgi:hypothetical protein